MSGIREATVSERIGHEQVTEFVMDAGDGDVQERKKEQTNCEDAEEYER